MKHTNIFSYILLLALVSGSWSCKKKDNQPTADIYYSVNLDGYTVTFDNQTTGAASYKWDFGDGDSSTDESPVHTYPGKGKYVPTLYATNSDGVTVEGSTVINISKASAVKLDDNTLSDWDTVTHNVYISGAGGGIFQKAKFDYNSDYVFLYFEMNATVADGNIFDFYLDADNNPTTGYTTWLFTNAGEDILIEGTFFDGWADPFYFNGATQNAWSWAAQSISEFYQIGTIVQDGSTLKFEMGFKRSKLKNLIGKGVRIGVAATKNDWSAQVGSLPDQGTDVFVLDMSE